MTKLITRIFIFLLILGPSAGFAHSIGDRAVGMGGAYTGLANDPSAAWYNPAGLVHIPNYILTVSGNAYQYKSLKHSDFVQFDEMSGSTTGDFETGSINVFPSTLIYGTSWGDSNRHAVSFSILMPASEKSVGGVQYQSKSEVLTLTYEIADTSRDYYFGPSYAYGNSDWSFGISAFGRLFERENSYTRFEDTQAKNGEVLFISNRVFSETYRHIAFAPTIGIQWKPFTYLRLGASILPPQLKLWGETDQERVETIVGSSTVPQPNAPSSVGTQTHLEQTSETNMPTPFRLRLGIGYESPDSFSLGIDAQLNGPIPPQLDRNPQLEKSTEAEHTRFDKAMGVDIAIGFEYVVNPNFKLRVGGFTEFSHNKHTGDPGIQILRNNTSAAGGFHHDKLGGTLGIGFSQGSSLTSIGLRIVRGTGKAFGLYYKPPESITSGQPLQPGDEIHTNGMQQIDSSAWEVAFIISGTIFEKSPPSL